MPMDLVAEAKLPIPWKSVRPGKISWCQEDVDEMAALWLSTFPQKAYDLIRKQRLPAGTRVVSVQSELSTPTCKEISLNYSWLLPLCQKFPDKVPSGFFLTDCMLALDRVMEGALLVPQVKQTKRDVAADESKRLKKLMGALRHLFRNCPDSSTDLYVEELKGLLSKSPTRSRTAVEEEKEESDAPPNGSDGDVAPIADAAESGSESSLVNPTDSDSGSDSPEPFVAKQLDFGSDHHVGTPEPMQPDNQLGLWDWDGNPLENPPDLKDEDMATPPTSDADLSPEEKRKRFWRKFVVPWPPLNKTPDSKMESEDREPATSESDSEPQPSSSGINRNTRSHRNSPTLTLSPKAGDRTSCDGGSDSESVSSSMSLVGEGAFEEAMVSSSAAAHKMAASSSTPMSTMHTPRCERPDWWGFPLVETPPKVKASEYPSKRTSNNKTKKGIKPDKDKKASFKHSSKPVRGLGAKVPEESLKYGEYDISFLREDARPDLSRNNLGKHSYTLRSSGGCLEVLLQKEAFFVKSVGPSGSGPQGQVSWKKNDGPENAWCIAKRRAGFVETLD